MLIGWLATALFAGSLSGQEPPVESPTQQVAQPHKTREIVLQNLSPFARRQAVAVVVPFAQGIAADNPELTINDLPTVWQPFGARWPDRSWIAADWRQRPGWQRAMENFCYLLMPVL